MQQIIQLGSHPAMTLLRVAAAAFVDTLRRDIVGPAIRHLVAMRTEQELGGLDERTLRDLGLCRSEIGSVASEITGDAKADAPARRVAQGSARPEPAPPPHRRTQEQQSATRSRWTCNATGRRRTPGRR